MSSFAIDGIFRIDPIQNAFEKYYNGEFKELYEELESHQCKAGCITPENLKILFVFGASLKRMDQKSKRSAILGKSQS